MSNVISPAYTHTSAPWSTYAPPANDGIYYGPETYGPEVYARDIAYYLSSLPQTVPPPPVLSTEMWNFMESHDFESSMTLGVSQPPSLLTLVDTGSYNIVNVAPVPPRFKDLPVEEDDIFKERICFPGSLSLPTSYLTVTFEERSLPRDRRVGLGHLKPIPGPGELCERRLVDGRKADVCQYISPLRPNEGPCGHSYNAKNSRYWKRHLASAHAAEEKKALRDRRLEWEDRIALLDPACRKESFTCKNKKCIAKGGRYHIKGYDRIDFVRRKHIRECGKN